MAYKIYQPFYADIDAGSETSIEKMAVNENELLKLNTHIRMIVDKKSLAFFGETNAVLTNISEQIGTTVTLPESRKPSKASIFVVIKHDVIICFSAIDIRFFKSKIFDKEDIIITIFRYLQDFAYTIILCQSADLVESFWSENKNPFSKDAHVNIIYTMEDIEHVELYKEQLPSQYELIKDHSYRYIFNNFRFQNNNSKYFLRMITDETSITDLTIHMKNMNNLSLKLTLQFDAHKPNEVLKEFGKNSLTFLENDTLQKVIKYHNNYVETNLNIKATMQAKIKDKLTHILLKLKEKTSGRFLALSKKVHLFIFHESLDFDLAAQILSGNLFEKLMSESQKNHNFEFDTNRLFNEFLHEFVQILKNMLKDFKGEEKELNDALKHYISKNDFDDIANICKIKEAVNFFTRDTNNLLKNYLESLKYLKRIILTPCVINPVQENYGKYSNLSYSIVNWQNTWEPEHFQTIFPIVKTFTPIESNDLFSNFQVEALSPINNGRCILSFVSIKSGTKQQQALVSLNSTSNTMHKIINFGLESKYMVLMEAESITIVNLFILKNNEIVEYSINDMLNLVEGKRFTLRLQNIEYICSFCTFGPDRYLLLLNNGDLFEFRKSTKDLKSMRIQNSSDSVTFNKRIEPSNGVGKYNKVLALNTDQFFLLYNENILDIYDINIILKTTIQVPGIRSVKIFTDNVNIYLSIFKEADIESYIFKNLATKSVLKEQREKTTKMPVKGNLIIDVIHASRLKYQINANFIGGYDRNDYILTIPDEIYEYMKEKFYKYLNTYSSHMPITIKSEKEFLESPPVPGPSPYLSSLFQSRVPIQICTIEENNIMPLVDGKRQNLSLGSSIGETVDSITLGYLERVLKELPKNSSIRVISIIGRQSSGKSYLLNRIFGTRFSVAATRCTDGIWMSYAKLLKKEENKTIEQDFIIFDCEGLFSVRRNELEETKLLTILASISDVTILNQDLNFNRYINRLFNNLNNAVDRVQGEKYFKGYMMMTVRDVASEEGEQAASEFTRNVQELNQRGEHKFLKRLFSGTMNFQCLNNYAIEQIFDTEIASIRENLISFNHNKYKIDKMHWSGGTTFLDSLKIVLLQIYNDDEQSADIHIKKLKLLHLINEIILTWGKISKIGHCSKEKQVFKQQQIITDSSNNAVFNELMLAQSDIEFEVVPEELAKYFFEFNKQFTALYFNSCGEETNKEQENFNLVWSEYNSNFIEFIAFRAKLITEFAMDELNKLSNLFIDDEKHNAELKIKEIIKSLYIDYSLCLETCAFCNLKCLERKGHKNSNLAKKIKLQAQIEEMKQKIKPEKFDENIKLEKEYELLESQSKNIQEELQKMVQTLYFSEQIQSCKEQIQTFSISIKSLEHKSQENQNTIEILKKDISNTYTLFLESFQKKYPTILESLQISFEIALSDQLFDKIKPLFSKLDLQPCLEHINKLFEKIELVKNTCKEMINNFEPLINNLFENFTDSFDLLKSLFIIETNNEIVRILSEILHVVSEESNLTNNSKSKMEDNIKTLVDQLNLNRSQYTSEQITLEKNKQAINEISNKKIALNDTISLFEQELEEKNTILQKLIFDELTFISKYGDLKVYKASVNQLQNNLKLASDRLDQILSQHPLLLSSDQEINALEFCFFYLLYFSEEFQSLHLSDHFQKTSCKSEVMESNEFLNQNNTKDNLISTSQIAKVIIFSPQIFESITLRATLNLNLRFENSATASFDLRNYKTWFINEYKGCNLFESLKNMTEITYPRHRASEEFNELIKELFKTYIKVANLLKVIDKFDSLKNSYEEKQKVLDSQNENCLIEMRKVLLAEITSDERELYSTRQKLERLSKSILNNKKYIETGMDEAGVEVSDEEKKDIQARIIKLQNDELNVKSILEKMENKKCDQSKQLAEIEAKLAQAKDKNLIENINLELHKLSELMDSSLKDYNEAKAELNNLYDTASRLQQEIKNQVFIRSLSPELYCLNEALKNIPKKLKDFIDTSNWEELSNLLNKTKIQVSEIQNKLSDIQNQLTTDSFNVSQLISQNESINNSLKNLSQSEEKLNNEILLLKDEYSKVALTHNKFEFIKTFIVSLQTLVQENSQSYNNIKEILKKIIEFKDENQKISVNVEEQNHSLNQQINKLNTLNPERFQNPDLVRSDIESIKLRLAQIEEKLKAHEETLEYLRMIKELHELEKGISCECPTDHKCKKLCGLCREAKPCKHPAGHPTTGVNENERHICDKRQHDCPYRCELCPNSCMYASGHVNPANHKCASTHQCKKQCLYCMNTCVKSIVESHEIHQCSENKCPERCILCGDACSGPHNHRTTVKEVTSHKDGALVKLHLCDKEHQCPYKCEKVGVCEVQYKEEKRTYKNPECAQEYLYIKPDLNYKQCAVRLKPNFYTHNFPHDCGKDHQCNIRCPECGSFCKESVGHHKDKTLKLEQQQHKSLLHRNKEFCYCVTRTEGAKVKINEGPGKKVKIYNPGENFIMETCEQQCKRKGRAHYHLKICPGGDNCGEKQFSDGVKHCGPHEKFYPFQDRVYDKYLCQFFWSHINWEMPSKDLEIQQCNVLCPHRSHSEELPQFCSLPAWHLHSESTLAINHVFLCHSDLFLKEKIFQGADIAFCIDTTSSMGSYIVQAKEGIQKIMRDSAAQLDRLNKDVSCLRFAIVSYKDHSDEKVVEKQDFMDSVSAINFLNILKAEGGGDSHEAALDGLDSVVSLSWRPESVKLLFHILDYPPHGKQFGSFGDDHPNGCPCSRKEEIILPKLKALNVSLFIVPLTRMLNQTVEEFQKYIDIKRIELNYTSELSGLIADTVCKTLEADTVCKTLEDPELSGIE